MNNRKVCHKTLLYPQINLSTQGEELVFSHHTAVTAGQQAMVVKMLCNMCYNLADKLELSKSHYSHIISKYRYQILFLLVLLLLDYISSFWTKIWLDRKFGALFPTCISLFLLLLLLAFCLSLFCEKRITEYY